MRAVWSGLLSFGLINIPVKLYSGSKPTALKFRLLDKRDLCPISYSRICRIDSHPVSYENIVRGYELEKGEYVVLDEEDFKKANIKKSRTISVESFTDQHEINPKYYEKPYFIEPDRKGEKAYVLLREALRRTNKSAIVKFVLKDKEYLGAIRPEGKILLLSQLRYENEMKKPSAMYVPHNSNFSEKEMDIMLMLVNELTKPFHPENHRDTFTDEIRKIIAKKSKGKDVKLREREPTVTEMGNLMTMLKRSLEDRKKVRV